MIQKYIVFTEYYENMLEHLRDFYEHVDDSEIYRSLYGHLCSLFTEYKENMFTFLAAVDIYYQTCGCLE